MKIIFAGGRSFTDISVTKKIYDFVLGKFENVVNVSGEAPGADSTFADYANSIGVKVLPVPAAWDDLSVEPCVIKYRNNKAYNALAGFQRNTKMQNMSDILVAVWDGKSKGTLDMIRQMYMECKPVYIFDYLGELVGTFNSNPYDRAWREIDRIQYACKEVQLPPVEL